MVGYQVLLDLVQQSGRTDTQAVSEFDDVVERNIRFSSFHLADEGAMAFGFLSECLLRNTKSSS